METCLYLARLHRGDHGELMMMKRKSVGERLTIGLWAMNELNRGKWAMHEQNSGWVIIFTQWDDGQLFDWSRWSVGFYMVLISYLTCNQTNLIGQSGGGKGEKEEREGGGGLGGKEHRMGFPLLIVIVSICNKLNWIDIRSTAEMCRSWKFRSMDDLKVLDPLMIHIHRQFRC